MPAPALPQLRNAPTHKRMSEGIRLVVEEDESVSEAARLVGVSRPRLSENVKAHREKLAEQQRRSEQARREAMVATRKTEAQPYEAVNETRRVPPIDEFVRMYFDGLKCPRHSVHHEIPSYQDEIMAKVSDPAVKRLLVNVPPGHSKSTTGTVFTTVYEIVRNPNTQIAILSGTTRMAQRFLRQIRLYLTDEMYYQHSSHNLLEEWGPFADTRGNLGSAQEFYVAGRQSAEKDPTVSAYGWGQQIQGTRMDRIICDDIALRENQKNPERVQDMLETITQDLLSRLDESGELAILGTRVFGGDVYGFLQELPAFEVIRYPCILDEEGRQTLWPDHFGFDAADRQRNSMSADLWELTYQNSDMIGVGASFTMEQIERCLDENRRIGDVPDGCRLVLGIDPAGANAQSGYTAMVLWAVHAETGRRFLVDLVNHKEMKAPQVFQQIKDFAARYPLYEVRVETNGLAAQLFQYNTELNVFLGSKGIRLSPHITGRNKWDPNFGVEAMAPLYHNAVVSIPWADYQAKKKFQPLIDQLIRFPVGKPDDLVMAAWFGELGCKDLMDRYALPAFDPRQRVPSRIRRNRRVVSFNSGLRAPTLEEERGWVGGRDPRPTRLMEAERFANVAQGHDGEAVPAVRGGVLTY